MNGLSMSSVHVSVRFNPDFIILSSTILDLVKLRDGANILLDIGGS